MILLIYKFLTSIIYFSIYPFLIGKAKRGDDLWRGRLGVSQNSKSESKKIWLHASSVGEVKVMSNLITYLTEQDAKNRLHLTVVTTNGFKTAEKLFGDIENIDISYFPLDAPIPIKKTIEMINPVIVVIAETEIWFNLISQLNPKNIPLLLVNGRMTESSYSKYRIISGTMKKLLGAYEKMFLKSEEDSARYIKLGMDNSKIEVTGDMKFDHPIKVLSEGRKQELMHRLNLREDDFLLTAVSTRPGEEEILLRIFEELKNRSKNIKLVIAPRHLERLKKIKTLLSDTDHQFSLYSTNNSKSDIILVDKMGIMEDILPVSNLAFVGGTMVDIGGHNILEPVWMGVPVLFGDSISNIKDASEHILENNYGAKVASENELLKVISSFIDGNITFARKTNNDDAPAPTKIAGDYILRELENV